MKIRFLIVVFFTSIHSISYAQDNETLSRVTLGIGAGYNHLFGNVYQASLSTGTEHSLQLQKLSRSNFVISSMLIFKLSKLEQEKRTNTLKNSSNENAKFSDRLSLNIGLNLLEVNSGNISFNKLIDGGIGIGYFISSNAQIALFYDIQRYRQLQDHIVKDYASKPIPNGNENYNALDESNNSLFYSKAISSISIKAIFSIGK